MPVWVNDEWHEVGAEHKAQLRIWYAPNHSYNFFRNKPGGVVENDEQMGQRLQNKVDELRDALLQRAAVRAHVHTLACETGGGVDRERWFASET